MSQEDAPNFRVLEPRDSCENCIRNNSHSYWSITCNKFGFIEDRDDVENVKCDSWEGEGDE